MPTISLVVFGMLCGVVPIITGALQEKLEIGVFGFVASIVSALAFGFYLAVPIAALFTFFLLKRKRGVPAQIIPFPLQQESKW